MCVCVCVPQIVKEVPQGLPLKVWYLVLSSSLLLHSHLSTFHTTLGTSNSLYVSLVQLPICMYAIHMYVCMYVYIYICMYLSIYLSISSFIARQEHFPQLLHTLSEFCDGLRENVVSYHSELCIASLLHDSGSHDWQNTRPFFEVCL